MHRSYWPPGLVVIFLFGAPACVLAQPDTMVLSADDLIPGTDSLADETEPMDMYEPLNAALGGDSVRSCGGYGCIGWVEDHYPTGELKHRGYYKDGQLLVYRNYHTNGHMEREFKVIDNTRCFMRTYHDNGAVRTEVTYTNGVAMAYSDHYPNGQLRYQEEKHPSLPYYLIMDLFAPDGKPISTLHLTDKKKNVFEQNEYWPNGQLKCAGRSQFMPARHDSQRIGDWTFYDQNGDPLKQERYIDGKAHETADIERQH